MIHFIVNPRAGSFKGIRAFRKLEPELIRYRLSYDVMFTQYPGHASEEAKRLCLAEPSPQIAVLGGDGTMHEVLEGIRAGRVSGQGQTEAQSSGHEASKNMSENTASSVRSSAETCPVTLMFLPCGSGNDFARGVHLTKEPAGFARALSNFSLTNAAVSYPECADAGQRRSGHFGRRKRTLPVDKHSRHFERTKNGKFSAGEKPCAASAPPSKIRLHYGCGHAQGISQGFFVSGGMGFDSSVTEEITMSPLKPLANRLHISTLAYLLLGIRQIFTEPQAPARIVVDGKKQLKTDRLFFLSAHKMRCEGGGFPFAPDASPTSDTLSVCIFYGMSRLTCAWALFLSLFGLHRYQKGVALLKCKQVEVFSQTFRSTHTDGEPLGFVDHVCFTAGEGGVCAGRKLTPDTAPDGEVPIDLLLTTP